MTDQKLPGARHRRDVIVTSALAFAGAGALVALWPFVNAFTVTPDIGTDTTAIDVAALAPGTTEISVWRGKPYVVRRRTADEASRALKQIVTIDRFARNENLEPMSGAAVANRVVPGQPHWIVMSAVCTKGDCLLRDHTASSVDDGVGWFCPCCASRYDLSGRIMSGPAPHNLPVPRYRQQDGRVIIGMR